MTDLRPRNDYLLLIDASSYIHRAYHALPKLTRQSDGMPTGALYGLCNSIMKMVRLNWTAIDRLPSYVGVIQDFRGKNWRHGLYPEYKSNRTGYDEALEAQLPWITTISKTFGLPSISAQGYEADDIIATYTSMALDENIDVVIATSDKDLCQLIYANYGEASVIIYDAMRDKGREDNTGALIGYDGVVEKFGVRPDQVGDFLALTGDTVDGVPGVPGIGPKSAARLLTKFDTLDKIISEAEWDAGEFKSAKEHQAIFDHIDQIRLSRKLVDLDYAVPVDVTISDMRLRQVESRLLRSMLMDLEFMSLLERVDRPARI